MSYPFFYDGHPYIVLLLFYSGTLLSILEVYTGFGILLYFLVTVKILKVGTCLFQNQKSPNIS